MTKKFLLDNYMNFKSYHSFFYNVRILFLINGGNMGEFFSIVKLEILVFFEREK